MLILERRQRRRLARIRELGTGALVAIVSLFLIPVAGIWPIPSLVLALALLVGGALGRRRFRLHLERDLRAIEDEKATLAALGVDVAGQVWSADVSMHSDEPVRQRHFDAASDAIGSYIRHHLLMRQSSRLALIVFAPLGVAIATLALPLLGVVVAVVAPLVAGGAVGVAVVGIAYWELNRVLLSRTRQRLTDYGVDWMIQSEARFMADGELIVGRGIDRGPGMSW